jgi:hypothetical protein
MNNMSVLYTTIVFCQPVRARAWSAAIGFTAKNCCKAPRNVVESSREASKMGRGGREVR